MLQQTRAQAVIPYYERFVTRFPSVADLANAGEEEILALWSGLGYYTRARNLHRAAALIHARGSFPSDYEVIRALPGVGDYTAAAIASIAFGLPYAVLDGNVLRVVARVQNDASDIAAGSTRERFRATAQDWLDSREAGAFNQALMELGATVCLTRNPLCLVCPLTGFCRGREEGRAAELPVKLRKVELVHIDLTLLVVRRRGCVLLRRKEADARHMAGFWELPTPDHLPDAHLGEEIGEFRHSITHHRYTFAVAHAKASPPAGAFEWFDPADLGTIPLSTTARKALKLASIL
jgi:A/G-specific adenine glycosylase